MQSVVERSGRVAALGNHPAPDDLQVGAEQALSGTVEPYYFAHAVNHRDCRMARFECVQHRIDPLEAEGGSERHWAGKAAREPDETIKFELRKWTGYGASL